MGRRRGDVVWRLGVREDLDERWLRDRYAESARDDGGDEERYARRREWDAPDCR